MKYEVIYSQRRSVSIKIKDGQVIVRAPIGLKDDALRSIIDKHKDWIDKTLAKEIVAQKKEEALSDEDINKLKKEARIYFCEKARLYANVMGVNYNRITITSAKTRFGSCSSAKNISFSYRLMLYPESAREYVIVHELAHLKEMNHSKRFYAIVEKYMPDYRERRKILKNK